MGGPEARNVLVMGLGNVLMGDDAFGPTVARTLEARFDLPPGVSALDVGTPGLDLMPYLLGVKSLVVVDTVASQDPPGTVKTYRKEEILKAPIQPRVNPHDPGLKEALHTLDFAGQCPGDVLLVGVVPANLERGLALSPAVQNSVDAALGEILKELDRLGVAAVPREGALDPDLWWRKGEP
jgi:hydrogenase maturation protease